MPSKKAQRKATATRMRMQKDENEKELSGQDESSIIEEKGDGDLTGGKRKEPPTDSGESSSKFPKTDCSDSAIISFLLSPEGLQLYNTRLLFPDLTPFEHLICAVILSRPISHNLGQRTIATVLNKPWSRGNVQNILDAGEQNKEGKTERVQAMEDANTQHRQKTASELGGLAQVIVDENWDENEIGSLKGLLNQVEGEDGKMQEMLRSLLKERVKGLGDTGLDIFLRRVQGCEGWAGIEWFIDRKARDALHKAGLPEDPDIVKRLVGYDRKDFVLVLERALGIVLEGKEDELKKQVQRHSKKNKVCSG